MSYDVLKTHEFTGFYYLGSKDSERCYFAEYELKGVNTTLYYSSVSQRYEHLSPFFYFPITPENGDLSSMALKETNEFWLRDMTPTIEAPLSSDWVAEYYTPTRVEFVTPPNLPQQIKLIKIPEYLDETKQVIVKTELHVFIAVPEEQGEN